MKYQEITVTTTCEAEDLVADLFWKYTDYGVAISCVKDVIELTEAKVKNYDYLDNSLLKGDCSVSLVKGFFPIDKADELYKCLLKDLQGLKENGGEYINFGTLEVVKRIVDGDDWIEVWRKHYRPIPFGKITVCPEWIKYEGDGEVVYIDSNMAFGTGEHETTAMCVKLIEKYIKPSDTVIDVGTGSGILGLAAAKLGAKSVIMTDIDPVAVEAANRNAKLNKVDGVCKATLTNLLDGIVGAGDIVVANITAEVLAFLVKDIRSYVKEGGVVILSGILNDRLEKVVNAYEEAGLKTKETLTDGEWSAVVFKA